MFCKCGCGREIKIKPYHSWYGIPDYISGHNKPHKTWTKEEIRILHEEYPKIGVKIVERLNRKSSNAVYTKAYKLGIKSEHHFWSPEEIESLKKVYPEKGSKISSLLCNRSIQSIYEKAHDLGVKNDIINRISQRIVPKLTPSTDLAYIMGVLKGDGYLFRNKTGKTCYAYTHGLGLCTINMEFANSFLYSAQQIGLNPFLRAINGHKYNPNQQDYFRVDAVSINFYNWWNETKNNYVYIRSIIKSFENEFLRGFYESEGTVSVGGLRPKLGMCNTDEMLIDFILEIVHKQGFRFRKYGPTIRENRKPLYNVLLQRKHEIPEFLSYINPCIKRGQ